MRLLRQLSVNDELTKPFPFKRELSMQAYLVENPEILNIDEMYSDAQIYNEEVTLKGGAVREGGAGNGRIDIVASYAGEHIAIIELKKEVLVRDHLNQLENYIKARGQLKALETPILSADETADPKWLGILVGSGISEELRGEISKGYKCDGVAIAAMTITRFRSNTGQVYITTDTYFENLSKSKDRTQYSYNGSEYTKGRLVLAVIRDHIAIKKPISYAKLEHDFPKSLQGSSGVFCTLEEANRRYSESGHKRHYIAPDEILELADGLKIAVCTQWGIGNINNFISCAQKQHSYSIVAVPAR